MPSERKASTSSASPSSRPRRTRTYWTKEEDSILISAVETFSGSPSQWSEIAKCLNGRSPKDCRKRWANGLNASLKKGPWTEDEDAKLRQAVLIYNYDWASISKVVGHRSGDQCSKRWREVVDPSINKEPWTPEEDELLLKLFAKHGSAWQEIKEHFSNRRGLQCRNRCCHLLGTRSKKGRPKVHKLIPQSETSHHLTSMPSPPSSHSSSSPSPPTPSPLLLNLSAPSIPPSQFLGSFPLESFSTADNVGNIRNDSNIIVNSEPTPDLSSSPPSINLPLHDFMYSSPEWSVAKHSDYALDSSVLNAHHQIQPEPALSLPVSSCGFAQNSEFNWQTQSTYYGLTNAELSSTTTQSLTEIPSSSFAAANIENFNTGNHSPSLASLLSKEDSAMILRCAPSRSEDPSFVPCFRGDVDSSTVPHFNHLISPNLTSLPLHGDSSLSPSFPSIISQSTSFRSLSTEDEYQMPVGSLRRFFT